MDSETMIDALTDDATTFASTMFFRNATDMQTDVLSYDGNVILASETKMNGKHDVWRALYECTVNPDTFVLFVTPSPANASGTMLLIEEELDRSPLNYDEWDVERSTDTEIEFDNGSRIKSICVNSSTGTGSIRGYAPDLLVVDNWVEEGYSIPQEATEKVLVPMVKANYECTLWVNDVTVRDTCDLTQTAFEQGVYVKQMQR